MIGSITPDVPFTIMTIVTWLVGGSVTELHMRGFFEDPWVIALHNIPHSFITVGLLLVLLPLAPQKQLKVWLWWFSLGLFGHILLDIPTHANDGPMFLYPLSQYRFSSSMSYWDPEYGGIWFLKFEIILMVLSIGGLWVFRQKGTYGK